jgi:hypothetical protein
MRPGLTLASLAAAALLAGGCAESMGEARLTSEVRRALGSGGVLHVVRAPGRRLTVHSPASSVLTAIPILGIVPAVVDDQRGSAWVRDYAIEDPAWSVKQLLATAIPARLGWAGVHDVDAVLGGTSADELRRALGAGHALVLWTEQWTLTKGTGWEPEVALSYQVHARLLRVSDGAVLWSGGCDVRTAPASMDRWQENGGALLRSEHARAAGACGNQLLSRLGEHGS